jgi:hypothetical protein
MLKTILFDCNDLGEVAKNGSLTKSIPKTLFDIKKCALLLPHSKKYSFDIKKTLPPSFQKNLFVTQ